MNRFRLDVVGTYVIAALAFALSYSNLVDLAVRAGYSPAMAWAWPLAVDGLAVVATSAVMRLCEDRTYAWILLGASTTVSVVAGAAAHLLPAGPLPGWAGAAVAVIPPLCLLVAPHLAVQLRREAASDTDATDAAEPTDAHAVDASNEEALHDASTDTVPNPVAVIATDAVTLQGIDAAADAPTDDASMTTSVDMPCVISPDQLRRTVAHGAPATDAALFDLTHDAPARQTHRPSVTPEQRAKVRHLAATTGMSGYEIAHAAGTSASTARRIILSAGGRDALRAAAKRNNQQPTGLVECRA
ncbi:DUF2637 domain-containing protein [Rhodococcus sp. BE178]|uniref:DUF2637 domain-containing protein n=1 Tax=Rhodococcus sp. BE178 TaxID=2817737 RepID=UPI003D1C4EE7